MRRCGTVSWESDRRPDKYKGVVQFPSGSTVHHRDDIDGVQRELRDVKGVSVLIYDQTCAAEKRRRRKRGTIPTRTSG